MIPKDTIVNINPMTANILHEAVKNSRGQQTENARLQAVREVQHKRLVTKLHPNFIRRAIQTMNNDDIVNFFEEYKNGEWGF